MSVGGLRGIHDADALELSRVEEERRGRTTGFDLGMGVRDSEG